MEADQEAREYNPQPTTSSMGDPDRENEQQPDPPPPAPTTSTRPRMDHNIGGNNNNSFIGRHRMAASISNLQNQIKLFQEELDQLESLGESSIVCKELAFTVGSTPDPLLPLTKGPIEVDWDRWFQPVHSPRRRWL